MLISECRSSARLPPVKSLKEQQTIKMSRMNAAWTKIAKTIFRFARSSIGNEPNFFPMKARTHILFLRASINRLKFSLSENNLISPYSRKGDLTFDATKVNSASRWWRQPNSLVGYLKGSPTHRARSVELALAIALRLHKSKMEINVRIIWKTSPYW